MQYPRPQLKQQVKSREQGDGNNNEKGKIYREILR